VNDCVFCKIGTGDIPAHKIYEDDKFIAFLDIEPSAPGHTMIVSKQHIEDIIELPGDLAEPMMDAIKNVVSMLEEALGSDNFTIGANSGRIVGRHVNHLHVHVIPRFPDDGGGYIQQVVENPPDEELENIKNRIIDSNK